MTPGDVLREARVAGLTISIARSGNLYVKPAERLLPELRALLLAHKAELLDHLRRAANDHGDDIEAWIERSQITGFEAASSATVTRLHAASTTLDKQIAAGEIAPADPDRYCWPNDPRTDAAMNTGEIDLFMRRRSLLVDIGFSDAEADELAVRLRTRDRNRDDSCARGADRPVLNSSFVDSVAR